MLESYATFEQIQVEPLGSGSMGQSIVIRYNLSSSAAHLLYSSDKLRTILS